MEPNMKTIILCALLSLAVTVYCKALPEDTVQDEIFAEVCMCDLSFYPCRNYYFIFIFNVILYRKSRGECFLCSLRSIKVSTFFSTADCLTEICSVLQNYLKQFFNLKEETGPSVRRGFSQVTTKLREMQRFFRLQVTGTLDADTLEVMKKPRCGVPDVEVSQYSTYGSTWKKNSLTYR